MHLEGKTAPDFLLVGSDGKQHALEDYRGRKVLLFFYPKDHTSGCTKEACGFRDVYGELRKAGVVVLGISKDGLDSHRKFIGDHQLPFLLLSDPDKAVMRKYGAWGKKTMYGKEVEGTIRSSVLIDSDGKVLKHWQNVRKAAEHPDEVASLIRSF